ncbi:hypothetical protein SAV14893_051170 [Streptomyces avermitilis]|uniref:Uncharacterized protein n=1 Tax=Streptomyces avermitilis TaxID=33903 RepID=A0A4D4MPK9_STRAX|nr:hypothetical protein SAVMC3_63480 [Streptomyces avermitilis]GDY65724.1 hypothetical protein SAV14893_051170 [Streptomyces avermitilis]GDY74058.1 hypothetical protein SAV31267_035430 [Streptomyces avermitilis]GDY83127.1 hypothetical protein SAVCW2_23260 [Streptomyces avermitilis]
MNDDAAIAYALAEVLEPAPGEHVAFSDVFAAVRSHLLNTYGLSAPMGEVKAVVRRTGVRLGNGGESRRQHVHDVRLAP